MPESLHTVLPRDIATDKEVKSNIFEKLKSCIKQGRRSFLFLTYVKAIWKYLHLKNMNISTPWTLKILFIFRERGRQGEREREKHQCVVASRAPPTGDLAHNGGMCPDQESNWWPFGSQASTQSTEPHWPGLYPMNFRRKFNFSVRNARL